MQVSISLNWSKNAKESRGHISRKTVSIYRIPDAFGHVANGALSLFALFFFTQCLGRPTVSWKNNQILKMQLLAGTKSCIRNAIIYASAVKFLCSSTIDSTKTCE